MSNGEFGQYTLPDETQTNAEQRAPAGGGYDPSPRGNQQDLERMVQEDPDVGDLFGSRPDQPSNADSNVHSRRVFRSQEVMVVQNAKGGSVAKIGFYFGVSAAVMGLVFLGGFLAEEAMETGGLFAITGCWLGLLGALFSVAGIILCIIGLALGAGLNRGKAIFGLIFSVLFWMMLGMEFALAVFILAAETTPEIYLW